MSCDAKSLHSPRVDIYLLLMPNTMYTVYSKYISIFKVVPSVTNDYWLKNLNRRNLFVCFTQNIRHHLRNKKALLPLSSKMLKKSYPPTHVWMYGHTN